MDFFRDLNYLDASSQQELNAYRSIGPIKYLQYLKLQEIRRRKRCKLIKSTIVNATLAVFLAFDVWIFISWIYVILHNTQANPVHSAWNFFSLIV